ncbi:hypothetical protein A3Q56_05843 [Intoshia linei]|uniref:MIR domain-containing protein n=1 Tax=Intoshia linei TaxID=1819745 RepID=A0A177AWS5_9BILA|nr:hypothetical protein A3Q56_05843 [Intoshia linei]
MNVIVQLIYFFLLFKNFKCNDITYGSVLKLINLYYEVRLHSHEVKYGGTGSGQQSVTAISESDDHNSYWKVMTPPNIKNDELNVKCGDTINLLHVSTKKKLHSHNFLSPLSSNYEISAFDSDKKINSDDNFIVECISKKMFWDRDDSVKFKHSNTNRYLVVNGQIYSHPIQGQYEVSGKFDNSKKSQWKAAEGIFIKKPHFNHNEKTKKNNQNSEHIHNEL